MRPQKTLENESIFQEHNVQVLFRVNADAQGRAAVLAFLCEMSDVVS